MNQPAIPESRQYLSSALQVNTGGIFVTWTALQYELGTWILYGDGPYTCLLNVEALVQSEASECGISGGHIGNGTGFSECFVFFPDSIKYTT